MQQFYLGPGTKKSTGENPFYSERLQMKNMFLI